MFVCCVYVYEDGVEFVSCGEFDVVIGWIKMVCYLNNLLMDEMFMCVGFVLCCYFVFDNFDVVVCFVLFVCEVVVGGSMLGVVLLCVNVGVLVGEFVCV